MPDATNLTTAEGLAALNAELAALEGEGRREIAGRIKTAREWGDLKENSEYHDAKNEQAHLETKIAQAYVDYAWQRLRLANNLFVAGSPASAQLLVQAAIVQIYALLSSPPSTYF